MAASTTALLPWRLARGMSGLARTINLAEPKTCERPVVQKLVSADVTRPCPHAEPGLSPGYPTTRAVPVRICRRKDLERACQPKLCDCPQKSPPRTVKQILCGWTIFGAKAAIAAGLLYWSVSEGIWGDSTDTEDFYFRIRDTIAADPTLDEVSLPRLEYVKFKILDSYNRAVLKIMGILVGVPLAISRRIQETLYPCEPEEEADGGGDAKR
ncbi:uncharacterized protein LOC100119104 [Nasonia vitripennis]|uniref:MICOS complex subunit MIC13 n=1 Tax=Nasonia vitripennis TaxID=7425 RepID=A0A7M7G306_NASVI|nr:uncharacterized protein LOC100119104 [Nasonia vitripennis]